MVGKSAPRQSRPSLSAAAAAAAMVLEALEVRRCMSASIDADGVLVVRGSAGDDMIDLGVSGNDSSKIWVDYVWGGGGMFDLADIRGIRIEGGAGDDLLTVDEWTGEFPLGVTIVGGDGNDTLMGGTQDDVLLGGAGEDTLFASYRPWTLAGLSLDGSVKVGNDLLVSDSAAGDVLDGEGTSGDFVGDPATWGSVVFHDGYLIARGTGGDDLVVTGTINDGKTLFLEVDWGGCGVTWNLDASVIKGVIVYGAQGNDRIQVLTEGYDEYVTPITVYGGAGDDTIVGGLADDVLIGGSGDDLIDGGTGADTIDPDGDDAYSANGTTPAGNGADDDADVTPVDQDGADSNAETDYDLYAVPPSPFGTTPIGGKDDQADDALWA
jgi:Ca2+-binding RTX toxin-like protein